MILFMSKRKRHRGPLSFEESTKKEWTDLKFKLSADDHAWLTAEAARLDISVAELLRRLIQAARSPK